MPAPACAFLPFLVLLFCRWRAFPPAEVRRPHAEFDHTCSAFFASPSISRSSDSGFDRAPAAFPASALPPLPALAILRAPIRQMLAHVFRKAASPSRMNGCKNDGSLTIKSSPAFSLFQTGIPFARGGNKQSKGRVDGNFQQAMGLVANIGRLHLARSFFTCLTFSRARKVKINGVLICDCIDEVETGALCLIHAACPTRSRLDQSLPAIRSSSVSCQSRTPPAPSCSSKCCR